METGTIVEWCVDEGAELNSGDLLMVVETDKGVVDFNVTDDFYLAKKLLPAGSSDLEIGSVVGVTVDDADDVAAFKDFTIE